MLISISQKNLDRLYALQQLVILVWMVSAALAVFVYELAIEPKLMQLADRIYQLIQDPTPVIDWLIATWWDIQEVSSILWDGLVEFGICFSIGCRVVVKTAAWVLDNSVMPGLA